MAFNLPVQNYFTKSVSPDAWVRPSDWPSITDAANEVQFLMSDINAASCTVRTQFSRTSGSQNIVIDWGDGTTNTVTATTQTDTTHQYTVGAGTSCSRGYTTFKVRVYFTGTGVSVLNACRLFGILLAGNISNALVNVGLLEAYYGDGTQTVSMTDYYLSNTTGSNSLSNFNFLEYVKLPSTITWASAQQLCSGCSSLSVLIMPTSASSLTSVASIVASCPYLTSINLPSNSTGITSLVSAFDGCNSLISVTLPTSLNSCTTFSNTFQQCWSLKTVTIPSINNCTTFTNTFFNCYSLEWVKFTSLPTFGSSTGVNFTLAFVNSYNLQNVYFPSTCSSNANYNFSNTFQACVSLKSIVFPSGFNPNTLASTFSGCSSLRRVIFNSGASNLNSMGTTFSSCFKLTDITLPSSVNSAGINLSGTFQSCASLGRITIPDNYLVTTMSSTFANCYSLKTITWTPGIQNSLLSLNSTYSGCFLLNSFTLPTSMTAVNSLVAAFFQCKSIVRLTFPSTMNAVTSASNAFNDMPELRSITLPTSMSSCANFSGMFTGCRQIRVITMTATVSTSTTLFTNCFNNCSSLETVTLPSVNQLSLVSDIQGMFGTCASLTTINNLGKIGSLTATPLVNGGTNTNMSALSMAFSMPFSSLILNGIGSTQKSNLREVRLLNTSSGQWTGSSPQINVSFTNMSTAQLIQLFNDMAAQPSVVSKTINITSSTGVSGLTAGNRSTITTKGWTITG
jgi:hypothetical protein